MESTADQIRRILTDQFQPVHLEIRDESAEHAGHAGAASGGGHYRVTIVSTRFEDLPPIARHRLLNDALASLLKRDIHALALAPLTPAQWKG